MVRRSLSLPERDGRAERHQRRGQVADRRAVGDVAADGPGVPHLLAAETPEQLLQCGNVADDEALGFGERDGGAKGDPVLMHLDLLQLRDTVEEDDRGEVAHRLGHPQADIGASGDERAVGHRFDHVGEIVDGCGEDGAPSRRRRRRYGRRGGARRSFSAIASLPTRSGSSSSAPYAEMDSAARTIEA